MGIRAQAVSCSAPATRSIPTAAIIDFLKFTGCSQPGLWRPVSLSATASAPGKGNESESASRYVLVQGLHYENATKKNHLNTGDQTTVW